MGFIIRESPNSNLVWGLWHVHESAEELLDGLLLSEFDKNELDHISHPTRLLEWVAARKAMQELALEFGINYQGIVKEANGKSYLQNNANYISISHTKDYAAVAVNAKQSVGLDIELLKDKIELIAHKFIAKEEFDFIEKDMVKLTIAWCVKEAVYKYLGVDGVSFKDHIRLRDFQVSKEGLIDAEIIHPNYKRIVPIKYLSTDQYCLAITV